MKAKGKSLRKRLFLMIAFLVMVLLPEHGQAAVTLIFFNAISQDGSVVLLWETATELDNAGFFINRSNMRESGYQRINQNILVTRGDGVTGARYEYLDENVVNGTTYWYRLEAIDLNQNSEIFDPIAVIPGTSATITPTFTPTTGSGTDVSITSTTPGSTGSTTGTTFQTPFATTNPYPGPATPTSVPIMLDQGDSSGLSNSAPGVPTATLIPLPSITVLFPATNTPMPILAVLDRGDQTGDGDQSLISRITRFWPAGLLIILWAIIALWFFVSHRQI